MLKIRVDYGDFFFIENAKVWINRDTENRASITIDAPRSVKVLRSKLVGDQSKPKLVSSQKKVVG